VLQNRQRTNPFYAALIVVGIAFTITAAAYFVMTLRGTKSWPPARQAKSAKSEDRHGLLEFLEQHGVTLMAGELGLLALATWGAIGTDHWWTGNKSSATRHDDGKP
jgi:predicted small integral membrane protein